MLAYVSERDKVLFIMCHLLASASLQRLNFGDLHYQKTSGIYKSQKQPFSKLEFQGNHSTINCNILTYLQHLYQTSHQDKSTMATAGVHPTVVNDNNEFLAAVHVLDRILKGLGRENKKNTGVLCSRDPGVIAAKLELTNLVSPHFPGVTRWFVPVAPVLPSDWTGRFSAYTTYLASGAEITPRTLSTEVGALEIVVSGSIEFGGYFLTQGDWIWLSPGEHYNFRAEEAGAVIFTMLPCVVDTRDVSEEIRLPNKLVDGTFIMSRDAKIKGAKIKLNHLEHHFETGQGVSVKCINENKIPL